MPLTDCKTFRWTVERYDSLIDSGALDHQRVELLQGRIIEMAQQKEPHAIGISLAAQTLSRCFGSGHYCRVQMPLHLGKYSKPEPDVAVVVGAPRDYLQSGTPTAAALVIEVAESTLGYDRGRKALTYARFGITDFWIVNLLDRQVEVYRQPSQRVTGKPRFYYADVQLHKPGGSIAPLAAPGAPAAVNDLLP